MKATALRRITIVLAALMVSACAGLRPDSDPASFAGSPPAPMSRSLDDSLPFTANFDAALVQSQDLRKHGELDQASRVLGQLVIAAPNDARVIGEYGKVMLESGHTDDAVAFLERAITLKGTDWTLFSALGAAYDQSAKHEAARAAFNHALALKPGEPAILSNLALSHIQTGELDEAERLLLLASGQDKDIPGIEEKLAMVRSLKGSGFQSSAIIAPLEPPPAPVIAIPTAPMDPVVQQPDDPSDQEPAAPDDSETENVALEVHAPAIGITSEPNPIKTLAANTPASAEAMIGIPYTDRITPTIVSSGSPLKRTSWAPPKAARASLASKPRTATLAVVPEPKRAEAVATPRALPMESFRPEGVRRAMTRMATIPPVVAAPPEAWESMVRVSLPAPTAAVSKPAPNVSNEARTTSPRAQQPSSWFDVLKRWSFAAASFFTSLWA